MTMLLFYLYYYGMYSMSRHTVNSSLISFLDLSATAKTEVIEEDPSPSIHKLYGLYTKCY